MYIRDRCSKSMEECYIQNSGPRQAHVQNGRLTFERGSCSKQWAHVRNDGLAFEMTGLHSKKRANGLTFETTGLRLKQWAHVGNDRVLFKTTGSCSK